TSSAHCSRSTPGGQPIMCGRADARCSGAQNLPHSHCVAVVHTLTRPDAAAVSFPRRIRSTAAPCPLVSAEPVAMLGTAAAGPAVLRGHCLGKVIAACMAAEQLERSERGVWLNTCRCKSPINLYSSGLI